MKSHNQWHKFLQRSLHIAVFVFSALTVTSHAQQLRHLASEVSSDYYQSYAQMFDDNFGDPRYKRDTLTSKLTFEQLVPVLSENKSCYTLMLNQEIAVIAPKVESMTIAKFSKFDVQTYYLSQNFTRFITHGDKAIFAYLRSNNPFKPIYPRLMTTDPREYGLDNVDIIYAVELTKTGEKTLKIKTISNLKDGLKKYRKNVIERINQLLTTGLSKCKPRLKVPSNTAKLHITSDLYALQNNSALKDYSEYLKQEQPDDSQSINLSEGQNSVVSLTSKQGVTTDITFFPETGLQHFDARLTLPNEQGEIGQAKNIGANNTILMSAMLNNRNHLIRISSSNGITKSDANQQNFSHVFNNAMSLPKFSKQVFSSTLTFDALNLILEDNTQCYTGTFLPSNGSFAIYPVVINVSKELFTYAQFQRHGSKSTFLVFKEDKSRTKGDLFYAVQFEDNGSDTVTVTSLENTKNTLSSASRAFTSNLNRLIVEGRADCLL